MARLARGTDRAASGPRIVRPDPGRRGGPDRPSATDAARISRSRKAPRRPLSSRSCSYAPLGAGRARFGRRRRKHGRSVPRRDRPGRTRSLRTPALRSDGGRRGGRAVRRRRGRRRPRPVRARRRRPPPRTTEPHHRSRTWTGPEAGPPWPPPAVAGAAGRSGRRRAARSNGRPSGCGKAALHTMGESGCRALHASNDRHFRLKREPPGSYVDASAAGTERVAPPVSARTAPARRVPRKARQQGSNTKRPRPCGRI